MSGPEYSAPVRLKSERAWRTYHGGRLIDELHGVPSAKDSHFPEDWIISAVRAINPGREGVVEGLNRLADFDMTLKDFVSADPVAALGGAHVASVGESLGVLVKLIDAAERLGVQCHPDKEKAREFFGSAFGKTECWHIVGGREIDGETPCVYMGFKPGVTREAWRDVFDRQNIPAMLDMLHRLEVKPGDTFLIEGGTPHAIGAGCLLVEIQEPTDYTFRTEKVTPQGFKVPDKSCHYGLGFDRMFECFHYEGVDETEARRRYGVEPLILESSEDFIRTLIVGAPRTDCFTLERVEVSRKCRIDPAGSFMGLYVLAGGGLVETGAGGEPVKPGDQFFVPASSEAFSLVAGEPGGRLTVYCAKPGALK